MSTESRGVGETVTRDIIIREQRGVPTQRFRKPYSLWQQAEFKKMKLTTAPRHCQQKDDTMQLEEENLRLLRREPATSLRRKPNNMPGQFSKD